jgi:F0F1-type ATP synthase assembly protein I
MMKEEKGNIEQMSERLFHYLRKRESSASQEAEDEVWSKISKQIDKNKQKNYLIKNILIGIIKLLLQ